MEDIDSVLCLLTGLKSMSSMNGKKCRIVGPMNQQEQRYPVYVYNTKETVLIKPCNLMPISPPQRDRTDNQSKESAQKKWKNRVRVDVDDRKDNLQSRDRENSTEFALLKGLIGREYKLKDNATILYYQRFLDESRVQSLWKEMMTLNWEQSQMQTRGGKTVLLPRLQSWMRDDGITNRMASLYQKQGGYPWSPTILWIKKNIEKLLGCKFQYVLLNYYRDGKDSIGFHGDTEARAKCTNVVGSVSLGGPRRFLLRHRNHKKLGILGKREFLLSSGCLLVMKDDTQVQWMHAVPKDTAQKYQNPRINLTFRQVCSGCHLCSK